MPELDSRIKKDDSGLLESEFKEEESLVKIAYYLGLGKDQIFNLQTLNVKKNKAQTLEIKKELIIILILY